MNRLIELAKPFPSSFIHDDGRGNAYVPHHIVTQRLIQIFGAPPRIEVLRELYDEGKLTGVVMRLTVPGFDSVEEAGEADNPQSKTNGARAKDACSDAIKRCAMRLGLGLHLWAQQDYFLHEVLVRDAAEEETDAPVQEQAPQLNVTVQGWINAGASEKTLLEIATETARDLSVSEPASLFDISPQNYDATYLQTLKANVQTRCFKPVEGTDNEGGGSDSAASSDDPAARIERIAEKARVKETAKA